MTGHDETVCKAWHILPEEETLILREHDTKKRRSWNQRVLLAKALCSVLCCKSDRLRCVRLTSPPAWSSVSRDSCFIFYNDNDSGNDDNNDSNILFLIYATFSYEPSKFKILRIWLNDGLKDWQRLKDYSRFFDFFSETRDLNKVWLKDKLHWYPEKEKRKKKSKKIWSNSQSLSQSFKPIKSLMFKMVYL